MKTVSWNVNGIRSISRYGFFEWLYEFSPDIIGLQEIKAQKDQIPTSLLTSGYHLYSNPAERKGYSGVAVYSKEEPLSVETKIGHKRFDSEGRFIKLNFKDFSVINVYIPNGGRDMASMEYKLDLYDFFIKYLKKLKDEKLVLMGDFNVAHEEIDLARPKENENSVMFTPLEREKLTNLINSGFIDTFRHLNKSEGFYTWWAYYRNSRERNIGWRIDYIFISKMLEKSLKEAFILKDVTGSDHCPIGIDIKI